MSGMIAALLILSSAPATEPPRWRLGEHDPIICFLWCYSDERNPVNIELARAHLHANGWTFHEWVGSASVVPGRWKAELDDELQDVWFTQLGVHWGLRSPGPVNFVFKAGVFGTWLHAGGEFDDATLLTPRVEVGGGIAERIEGTLGWGTDGISVHIGWRF